MNVETQEQVTKEQVKEIVLEVLGELAEKTHLPDNLALFLYRLTGDFHEFKGEVRQEFKTVDVRFDAVDVRFDAVDARLDGIDTRLGNIESTIVTKGELKESLKDVVTNNALKESLKDVVTNDALNALNNALSENMKDMVTKIGVSMRGFFQEEFDKRYK
jgi:hypothetical protein